MFSQHAQKYWNQGLPAIPLRPNAKIPALNRWQTYAANMPTEQEREEWLTAYSDGNIGLPLGPQSGIVALDLDSLDPMVEKILDRLMPPTPWNRIGKKGAVYAFKYNGERTYRVKDEDGSMIFEVLSRGAQIVLPPSIHPDTMRPYVSNTNLYEVLDELVCLPLDFESRIRQELIAAGVKLSARTATKVSTWVPSGGRDAMVVANAGILARGVLRSELTLLEAQNQIQCFVAEFTERVAGDDIDPSKGAVKLMEFIRRDVTEHHKVLPVGWSEGMSAAEIADARAYFGETVEAMTADQLRDQIQVLFLEVPVEDIAGRTRVIENVLVNLARSTSVTSIEAETVLTFVHLASGKLMTLASLRKRMRELQGGELLGEDHTEIAQAVRVEIERTGELRYHESRFYQWWGSHWKELVEADLMRSISTNFGHLPAARRFSDHKGIIQVMQVLCHGPLGEGKGVNFANGYLTTDCELLNHDPKYGLTYCLPYRYVPDESAPHQFMSLLDTAWSDDPDYLDKVECLRQAIAVTLFGMGPDFQRAICLYGVAHSGKSQVINVIRGLIPPEASSQCPPHDWNDRFLPTSMANKIVNFCGELSEDKMISGADFKQIVEGSDINGQLKGGQIFTFRPKCTHWFSSNFLPRSKDTSAGFTRRWLLLGFNKPVEAGQRRVNISDEILEEEREAIVAWALPAIQDVMRNQGYTLPTSHVDLENDIANLNNNVRAFLCYDGLVYGNKLEVDERSLYSEYYVFCKVVANSYPMPLRRFRATMTHLQRDFEVQMIGHNDNPIYRGVAIKQRQKRAA